MFVRHILFNGVWRRGDNYWDYYAGALSVIQETTTHLTIGYP